MRLRRLEMVAFGPFTDALLDFGDGTGLHLVSGANEAGKSSSLRALRQFLYGMPHRFNDNFLHENKAIEVRGELEFPDGARLALRRRKARKNDLLDLDANAPLDQARLTALMGGVTQDTFGLMFGFDHRELVAGGEDVLAAGGALGRTLFAATSGLTRLHQALARLKAEEEALFTPRGGAGKRVNALLSQLKDLRREQREALVSPGRWQELSRSRDALAARLETLQAELDQAVREVSRLKRYQEGAVAARRRAELRARLAELGQAPVLEPGFAERRTAAVLGLETALRDALQAREALEGLEGRLAGLAQCPELMAAAELVDRLYRETSQHAKALRDADKHRLERTMHLQEAVRILDSLRPDLDLEQAGDLRLKSADQARIQELGRRHEALLERRDRAERDLARQERELEAARARKAAIPAPAETAELASLLTEAAAQGDPQARWGEARAEAEGQERRARDELQRLGRWQGGLDGVGALAVPDQAVVQDFGSRMKTLEADRRAAAKELGKLDREHEELTAKLKRFMAQGAVPRPGDLRRAREVRDSGWSLIRRTLAGNEPGEMERSMFLGHTPGAGNLPQAYEASVLKADEVADALYQGADRVARRAELETAQERCARRLQAGREALEELESEAAALEVAWRGLWDPLGVAPGDPVQMLAWQGNWRRLVDMLEALHHQRATEARLEAETRTLGRALGAALERIGEPLPGEDVALALVLAQAQAAVERHGDLRRQAASLAESLAKLEKGIEDARAEACAACAALDGWRREWSRAVAVLGLGADDTPAQAQAVLDGLGALFAALDEAARLETRVQGIQADYEAYTREVRATCHTLAPQVEAEDPAEAAAELFRLLKDSQAAAEQQADFLAQKKRQQERLEAAESAAVGHEQALRQLCAQAGCAEPGGLQAAEAAARRRAEVVTDLAHAEDLLRPLAGSEDLDAFAAQALAQDPDEAVVGVARLDARIAALDPETKALREELGGVKRQVDDLDGTSLAAEKAQQAQEVAAEIQDGVDRLVRLRLASGILAAEVERYRRENQGPVLERASALFRDLTLESFAGLETDFDEKGQPVLLGVRRSGERLGVTGMSDGTRDQLYLALRLAGLHRYLDNNPPMPFIVDDILVNFDDRRSRATFTALADLARRTQVVFFTHHDHLADLAAQAVPADVLHTLSLD